MPFLKSYSFSCGQEIPCLYEIKTFIQFSQTLYSEAVLSSLHANILPKTYFNIILPLIPTPVSQVISSLQAFRPKFCLHFSSLPFTLTDPPLPNPLHNLTRLIILSSVIKQITVAFHVNTATEPEVICCLWVQTCPHYCRQPFTRSLSPQNLILRIKIV